MELGHKTMQHQLLARKVISIQLPVASMDLINILTCLKVSLTFSDFPILCQIGSKHVKLNFSLGS